MKSDIEIAQEARMKPIAEIAAALGLADEDVIPYGRYKAKINHRLIHKAGKQGKLVTEIIAIAGSESQITAPPAFSKFCKKLIITTLKQFSHIVALIIMMFVVL